MTDARKDKRMEIHKMITGTVNKDPRAVSMLTDRLHNHFFNEIPSELHLMFDEESGKYLMPDGSEIGSGGTPGGVEEAPKDGKQYLRYNGTWVELTGIPPADLQPLWDAIDEKADLEYISFSDTPPDPLVTRLWFAPLSV